MGLVIAGASNGSATHVYDSQVGVEEVTLTASQSRLPEHTHAVPLRSGYINNTAFPGSSSAPNVNTTVASNSAGPLAAEEAHTNLQPTKYRWGLIKD